MKQPKRLLSQGATDFERQLLRAVASERPSALLRSRMQRSLGLVGPLAWASNVKAMFGGAAGKAAAGAVVAGVVIAGGIAAYQLVPSSGDAPPRTPPPARIEAGRAELPAPPQLPAPAQLPPAQSLPPAEPALRADQAPAGPDAPEGAAPKAAHSSEDGRLREEIALLDAVKAALQRGERDQARQNLDVYRQRFPEGILRREANVLRRRAEAKPGRAPEGTSYDE